jgi:hypothetical protein
VERVLDKELVARRIVESLDIQMVARMSPRLYGYADVGRFGLGHGLLAWGRCVVWAHECDASIIAPQWLRLRIGPYIRGERDKRFYYGLFHRGRQIGGVRRAHLLTFAERLDANSCRPSSDFCPTRDAIVVFSNAYADNEGKYFHELVGRSKIVREALLDMTRPRFHPSRAIPSHIALHVRGGDFSSTDVEALKKGGRNVRLPIDWYVEMLRGLRKRLERVAPAIVYSDCADVELAPLLSLPKVRRSDNLGAITDMLSIAGADVLISSNSGFSRWGAYLGDVPRICFPGQRCVRILGEPNGVDLEPECEAASEIPEAFFDNVMRALGPDLASSKRSPYEA